MAALRIARRQLRLASDATQSWRLEMVLSDIEDELAVHLGKITDAVDDDDADREASSEAQAQRQTWLPLRAA